MSNTGIRVFVYGTLKQGHPNHRLLERSQFLGRCVLEGPYSMVDLGWFPGIVRDPTQDSRRNRIFGEVYLVDESTLDNLDVLESNGRFYTRDKVYSGKEFKNVWAYFLPTSYLERNTRIAEGWWHPNEDELAFIHERTNAAGSDEAGESAGG